jgi:hypothetical protein
VGARKPARYPLDKHVNSEKVSGLLGQQKYRTEILLPAGEIGVVSISIRLFQRSCTGAITNKQNMKRSNPLAVLVIASLRSLPAAEAVPAQLD